jgi:hypothetical protein
MHDIDRTIMEYSPELQTYEQEQYEQEQYEQEQFEYGETEWGAETGVFSEAEEMELAAELLEVTSEGELDRFLGGLIMKSGQAVGLAGQTVGLFVNSAAGRYLGRLLKGAAKKALPMVAGVIGGDFGLGSAQMSSQVSFTAAQIFGLELEGLSQEDQEYEAAKGFVRFAGEAAKNAASAPPTGNPQAVAQSAVMEAAEQLAPGLVNGAPASTDTSVPGGGRAGSGRWIRRDNKIVLLGV